jgi:prepilin-type N-terminal cleavage/methylation domain-containing protein
MQKGFSLLELSVVIVLMSLLAVSVVIANNFIEQTKLASFIKQINGYKSSVKLFKLTYNALPGDFAKANLIIDENASNGNGDGVIDWDDENYYAWHHLAAVEYIKNNFSGVASSGIAVINDNVPQSLYAKNVGYSLAFVNGSQAGYGFVAGEARNILAVGGECPNCSVYRSVGQNFLTTSEAYKIDKKFDDSYAKSGFIYGAQTSGTDDCYELYTDNYDSSSIGDQCFLMIDIEE